MEAVDGRLRGKNTAQMDYGSGPKSIKRCGASFPETSTFTLRSWTWGWNNDKDIPPKASGRVYRKGLTRCQSDTKVTRWNNPQSFFQRTNPTANTISLGSAPMISLPSLNCNCSLLPARCFIFCTWHDVKYCSPPVHTALRFNRCNSVHRIGERIRFSFRQIWSFEPERTLFIERFLRAMFNETHTHTVTLPDVV